MRIKILVVDDEKEVRSTLSRHFRSLGFEVAGASDGEEALEKMRDEKRDIVVADIVMPGMDGIDLLRAINKQYPMTHVIMLSGFVNLDNALACMRLGADTVLTKPLENLRKLDKSIEDAVEGIQHWVDILNDYKKTETQEVRG